VKRLFHWIRSAWLMLGITLFLLALLEVASFLYLRRVSSKNPRWEYSWLDADAYRGNEWIAPYFKEYMSIRLQWEPYLYWRRRPFKGTYINVGEDGLRRTVLPPAAEQPGTPTVMVFGGSTTWGEGVREEHTIPSELARILAERGVPARVVNAAEGGYVSTQEMLRMIRFLQTGRVPDVAVFYHGLNDMYSAAQSGEPGLPSNESNRREEFNVSFRRIQVYRLALFGARTGLFTPMALRYLLHGPMSEYQATWPADIDRQVAAVYASNVKAIRALGKQFGFETCFAWQPVIYQKPHRTAFEQKMVETQPKAWEDFFGKVDARIRERERALAPDGFVNIGELFAQDTKPIYIDFCHITEEANRRVAERLADEVEKALRRRVRTAAE
jgi:lysophospholipase L1-like esterase